MGSVRLINSVAWIALALGATGAWTASAVLALSTPEPVRPKPMAQATNDAEHALESQLNDLAATAVGPGHAVVTANVVLNNDKATATSLTYGKRGTAVQASTVKTTALGYKRQARSVSWAHNTKLSSTRYATGRVRRVEIAAIVDAGVPARTVKALKRELATAAGLHRARGDRISVTRTGFAPKPPTSMSTLADPQVRSMLRTGRWALLGGGAFVFAWLSTLAAGRRTVTQT